MALDEIQIQDYLTARDTASRQEGFDSTAFTKAYSKGLDKGFSRDVDRADDGDDGGFVKQTTTALAGGAVDAAELWMRAIRAIDPDGGSTVIRDFATSGLDSIKNFLAKHPSLAPDANVEKGIKSWWSQGVRSLIPSLLPSLVGGTAGLIGGPAGAAVGGGALSSAVFGLAEFDKFHEEVEDRIKELGMSDEEAAALRAEARSPAIWSALTEGGLEGAANALQIRTLGKFLPGMKGAKGVAKKSIKNLFTKNRKQALVDAGKTLAITSPVEVGTEFAQSAIETKFRKDIGLTDMSAMSAGIQALGPAMVTNLLFFGMGKGANAWQRYNIKNSLEKAITNPGQRRKAIRDISNTIRGIGGEVDIGGGEKLSADEYATRLEKSAKGFVNAELDMNLNNEVGVTNTLGQYVEALRNGSLKLSVSRKMEQKLEKSLDKEDMSTEERVSATQLHQGLKGINEKFAERQRSIEVIDEKKIEEARGIPEKQRAEKKAARRKKGKEVVAKVVEADRLESLATRARGEQIAETDESKAAKELTKERPEDEEFVTAASSEALFNLSITNIDDVKARLKKERDVIKSETDLTKVGEKAELEQQAQLEARTRKEQREALKTEKERPLEVAGEVSETQPVDIEEVKPPDRISVEEEETEPTTEELEAEEVRPTELSEDQVASLKEELKDENITTEEKEDIEKALDAAGVEFRPKPLTERQIQGREKKAQKSLDKEIDKIVRRGGVQAVGKAPKGKKKVKVSEAQGEFDKLSSDLSKNITILGQLEDGPKRETMKARIREQQAEKSKLRATGRVSEPVTDFLASDIESARNIGDSIAEKHPEIPIAQVASNAIALTESSKLEGVDIEGVKTVGLGITPQLEDKGQVSLKGHTVKNIEELATLAQVYRNPSYETLRVFYLKGRKIVGQEGVTSRLAGHVEMFEGHREGIKEKIKSLGANGVYIMHNHPSGDPTPSALDTKMTRGMSSEIKEIIGHVVINSGKFAFIDTDGKTSEFPIKTDDRGLEASIPNNLLGIRMAAKEDVVRIGKAMQAPKGWASGIYMTGRGNVRALQEIPIKLTLSGRKLGNYMRARASEFGSSVIGLTIDVDQNPEMLDRQDLFTELIREGTIADVLMYDKDGVRSLKIENKIKQVKDEDFFLGERIQSIVAEPKVKFESEVPKARKTTANVLDNDVHRKHPKAKAIMQEKMAPRYEARTVKEIYKKWTTNLMTKFRQGVIDQYASVRVLDEKIWKLIQQTQSVNGAIETLFNWGPLHLTEGVPDTSGNGKQGLADALKPLGNEVEPFLAWVAANRAKKLLAEGKERNLTADEIEILLKTNSGEMSDGRSRKSVWRKANKDMMKLHKSVVDIGIKTGTINKAEAETWDTDFYIPFFRHIAENDVQTQGPKTLGGLTNQTAIRQLRGREVPIADMLSNIMLNWNHILSASMKNQSARAVLAKAENNKIEGGDPVARRLADDMEVKENEDIIEGKKGRFEVIDRRAETEKSNVIGRFATFEEAEQHLNQRTERRAIALAKSGDRMVFVRENGKKVWYEVNEPNVYAAIANLQWDGFNNTAMKAMRSFKRFLTFGVTFSPEFKIRNLIRDTITAIGTSKISINMMDNAILGSKTTFRENLSNARIRAGGGFVEFGHQYGTDPEKEAIRIRKGLKNEFILDNPNALKKFNSKIGGVFKWWGEFGSKLENINRGALAAQELDKGKSFLEANFQARDLLDFNRQGAFPAVRFLIDTVPFLNARIQGLDKLGRSLSGDQKARALATIGAVSLASMLLYISFKDDDDFQAREEWDRDTYWWFKLPGSELAYRIPKPFEIGAIGTMAERMLEQYSDDKVHGELFFERLKFALTQTFSFDAVPQIAKPIIELAANKNFFTDRPIETLAMQNLSPTQRRKAWTSETAIVMSQGLNKIPWEKVQLSPVQVEHLVQGYLGWVGATAIGAVDQVFTQPLGDFPGRPSRRIEELPIIGPFVRSQPARATKYSTLFYEQLKEMNEVYADIRNFRTIGERDKAINLARKEKDTLKFRKLANRRQKLIASYTKRMRLVRLNKTMTAKEKRMRIDRLTEIKNRLLKTSVERLQS